MFYNLDCRDFLILGYVYSMEFKIHLCYFERTILTSYFSATKLCVHTRAIKLWTLILCPITCSNLLWLPIVPSLNPLVLCLESCHMQTEIIVSSHFQYIYSFIYFSCLITPVRTSHTTLNTSGTISRIDHITHHETTVSKLKLETILCIF